MNIYKSITELVGRTPLMELKRIEELKGLEAKILAKLEFFNPGGSVKDRIAKAMIEDAEKRGALKKGSVIIEPTSGNTGIGLAAIAAAKGYRIIITMPETMSVERRNLMKAYGAEVVLTDGAQESTGESFGSTATTLISGFLDLSSFPVPLSVPPVPTPATKISRFIPETLDTSVYDEVITVKSEDAFETGRLIAETEGILVGISSGAALWAALQLAKLPKNKEKNIVVLLPDTGERYLSTAMFS